MENKKEIIALVDEYIGYKKQMEKTSRRLEGYIPYAFCDHSDKGEVQMLEDNFDKLAEILDAEVITRVPFSDEQIRKVFFYKDIKFFTISHKEN